MTILELEIKKQQYIKKLTKIENEIDKLKEEMTNE
jgi:hypothetical protein